MTPMATLKNQILTRFLSLFMADEDTVKDDKHCEILHEFDEKWTAYLEFKGTQCHVNNEPKNNVFSLQDSGECMIMKLMQLVVGETLMQKSIIRWSDQGKEVHRPSAEYRTSEIVVSHPRHSINSSLRAVDSMDEYKPSGTTVVKAIKTMEYHTEPDTKFVYFNIVRSNGTNGLTHRNEHPLMIPSRVVLPTTDDQSRTFYLHGTILFNMTHYTTQLNTPDGWRLFDDLKEVATECRDPSTEINGNKFVVGVMYTLPGQWYGIRQKKNDTDVVYRPLLFQKSSGTTDASQNYRVNACWRDAGLRLLGHVRSFLQGALDQVVETFHKDSVIHATTPGPNNQVVPLIPIQADVDQRLQYENQVAQCNRAFGAKPKIMVIGPGMNVYSKPEDEPKPRLKEMKKHYDVRVIEGHPEGYGPNMYPSNREQFWVNGYKEVKKDDNNLASLAFKVIDEIEKYKPDVIVCGSRGGQITIGMVWKAMFDKIIPVIPCVVLNAGCIYVPSELIPPGLKLVLVTAGQDYFEDTKDPDIVKKQFIDRLPSSTTIHHVHYPDADHNLESANLTDIFRSVL